MALSSSPAAAASSNVPSNLHSFLHSVTPIVCSKPLPRSCMHDLNSLSHPVGKGEIECFALGDLWACYDEWSAYGSGTPILLSNGDNVVQYYVPYLSAIQIYTHKSATSSNHRADTATMAFESESWSDDSDKFSRSLSNNSSKTWDSSISGDSSLDYDGSWPIRDRLGYLYFQYFETCSPYWRIPFAEKVNEFVQNYPGLMTLKNVDLSPASWMAVAWYPIYHIPTKGSVKDLSACFLTYHTLSSSFQEEEEGKCRSKGRGKTTLPPFGLATYKMQGDLWIKPDTSDHERLIDLHSAADSWLKQLNVQHHDFNFFTSHSTMEMGVSL